MWINQLVKVVYPLKQGLKRQMLYLIHPQVMVKVVYPLKQGLKLIRCSRARSGNSKLK